jgi:hypothetical protein
MPKLKIKAYDAVIHNEWYEDGASVLIGVIEKGHPDNAFSHEWWMDEKIYYYILEEEMQSLKAGDVLNDGEDFTILEIDKENPTIFEVDYELDEVQ